MIDIPYNDDGKPNKWSYRVFIDPSANYWIRKIVGTSAPLKVNGRSEMLTVRVDAEVKSFEEIGQGVKLPKQLVVERSDSKFRDFTSFEYKVVNDPISDDQFVLTFPEWCLVRDMDARVTHVMNGDGARKTSFATPEELNMWMTREGRMAGPGKSRIFTVILINVFAAIVLLIAFLDWRRRGITQAIVTKILRIVRR